ncbi:MAG TPA: O-antigen ligase family protein [Solirubrobacteraceae bacterium]|nr:O-antigen ligase family protein [Solirubrobacteraceae bacterium]
MAAILAGALGALILIALLVWLMRRDPRALPLLAVFALPFRLPISADGRTVNLLVPLYVVVAAGVLAQLLPRLLQHGPRAGLRADTGTRADGADARPLWRSPRGLEWLLLAAVVLYVLQASYSSDHAKAAENVAFFYVPFGLLFLLLRDVAWTRSLALACLGVAVTEAMLFAGVGFVEYARKELFLNPKVVAANQYDNYFRVNSVFFDPSIYGRFLALVMLPVATIVLWSSRRREVLIGAGVLAWLLAGLVTSFSQSSIAALLLGLAVLAAHRWDVLATVYVTAALVAIAGVVLLLAPANLHFGLKGSGGSTSNATSGRTTLVSGGLKLFADRPLEGWGSGSFETEYKRHGDASAQNATSASHTIPITVAAEQGVVGLALYIALLVCAFAVLFTDAGRSPPRIALAACFAALVLHTWTYADFLEDPFTWTLLAVGVSFARRDVPFARGE